MINRYHECKNPEYCYHYEAVANIDDYSGKNIGKWVLEPDEYKIEIVFCPYCGVRLE